MGIFLRFQPFRIKVSAVQDKKFQSLGINFQPSKRAPYNMYNFQDVSVWSIFASSFRMFQDGGK
jgi:hypothetical protein